MQFGALHDDALAGLDAGGDQHALAVERLDPHRARLEALRARRARRQGPGRWRCARRRRAAPRCPASPRRSRQSTVTNWPTRSPVDVAVDREMHRDRLVAVGEAGAAIGEGQRCALRGLRAGAAGRCQRIEAQRLDPQPRRIDDLEHDRVGLRHLAGDRRAVGDDAIDRRDQGFRLAPRPCRARRADPSGPAAPAASPRAATRDTAPLGASVS